MKEYTVAVMNPYTSKVTVKYQMAKDINSIRKWIIANYPKHGAEVYNSIDFLPAGIHPSWYANPIGLLHYMVDGTYEWERLHIGKSKTVYKVNPRTGELTKKTAIRRR